MEETGLRFRAARPHVAIATVGRIVVVEIEANAVKGRTLYFANSRRITIGTGEKGGTILCDVLRLAQQGDGTRSRHRDEETLSQLSSTTIALISEGVCKVST